METTLLNALYRAPHKFGNISNYEFLTRMLQYIYTYANNSCRDKHANILTSLRERVELHVL